MLCCGRASVTLQKGSVPQTPAGVLEGIKEQVDKEDPQMSNCAFDKSLHQKL